MATQSIFAQTIDNKFWETDGIVNTVFKKNNRLYLGGKFNYVGPNTGSSIMFNNKTNSQINSDLKIMGLVNTIVKDTVTGKIFIGGEFNSMGRKNLLVLNADGSLNPLNIPVNGPVKALCVASDGLLVGGLFDKIGTVNRNNCAAVNVSNGQIMSVNPNPDGEVRAFALAGAEVIMGGAFTNVMGQTRNGIASFSMSSSNLQSLNNSFNGIVNCLQYENGVLYVGGEFSNIDTCTRNNFAAIDLALNEVMPINPDINGTVNTIALTNNSIVIGGSFNTVGTEFRNNLVEIDKAFGIPTLFDPAPSGEVKTVVSANSSLFIGGSFNYIGNSEISNFAQLDMSGILMSSAQFNNSIHTLIVKSDTVIAGGTFSSFGGKTRHNFAALDFETGALINYSPDINEEIKSIEFYGNSLAIGGKFSMVNNVIRNGFALIDTVLGDPIAINADVAGQVNKIIITGNSAYLGGAFDAVNANSRNSFARISLLDGSLYPMNINIDGEVTNLKNYDNYLYIMGKFSQVNDSLRKGICRINLFENGNLDTWNPKVNNYVYDLVQDHEKVYIGGAYTEIDGVSSNSLNVVDTMNAQLIDGFDSKINFEVSSIEFDGDILFAADLNGSNGIHALHSNNSELVELNFKGDFQSINELKLIGDYFFVSGNYQLNNGNIRNNLTGIKMSVSDPDLPASNIAFSDVTPLGMKIHFKGGNGDKHLIIGRQSTSVNVTPVDGVDYSGSNEFGKGSAIGNGNFVISNSTDTVIEINSMNKATQYHFAIYEANGIGTFIKYLKTSPAIANESTIAGYDPPTISASTISAKEIKTNSMTISWQNGNGAKRIVLAREGSPVNQVPKDSSNYFYNFNFGDGYELGIGNFVVYNGQENQVQIFNLKPGVSYYYAVFEYNGIAAFERVKTTDPATANFATLSPALEPTQASSNLAFSDIGTQSVKLKWTAGNGEGRIIIASESVEQSALPSDGETYLTDGNFNGQLSSFSEYEKVIYIGAGDSTVVNGLNPGSTYYFGIVEYNGNGFTINYANELIAKGNVKMKVPGSAPVNPSKAVVFTKVTSDSIYLKWTNGVGQGRVLFIKKGGYPTAKPISGISYYTSANFGDGDSLEDGSYAIYDGISNEAAIANLEPNTVYGVVIFDYNIGDFGKTYQVDSFAYGLKGTLPASGIQIFVQQHLVKLYPNPVENMIHLEFLKPMSGKIEINISDISGKNILEKALNSTNENLNPYLIDVSALKEGNYYITILHKKEKLTQPFIISK